MLEKIAGVTVLTGLVLSVVGAVIGNENMKTTGNLVLLIIATIAGYYYLRYYVRNPVREFSGTCIEQKPFSAYYILSFRIGGGGIYTGRASPRMSEKVKIGDKAKIKVKGKFILEVNKIS